MFRFSIAVLVLILSVCMISNYSYSQGNSAEINTLKGLKTIGIGVGVEEIDADAAADGLDKKRLVKMVTQQLKKSGIKVLTDLELGSVKGQPMLLVNINTVILDSSC